MSVAMENAGAAPPVEHWAPLVSALVVAALLAPIAYVFSTAPALMLASIASLIAVPPVICVLLYRPAWTPYLLIASIHVGLFGARLPIAGVNIRPNMAVAILAASVLAARWLAGREAWRPVSNLALLLGTNGVYLLATLLNPSSPFFVRGLADCALFLVNVLQYLLVFRSASRDRATCERLARFFVACTTVFSTTYVLLFLAAQMGFGPAGRILEEFAGETGMFVRVGNLGVTEGSYVAFAVAVLLSFFLLLRKSLPWNRTLALGMLAANCAALALTFGRGPWLAVAVVLVGVLAVSLFAYPWKEVGAGMVGIAAMAAVLVAGPILYLRSRPAVEAMFAERSQALLLFEVGTAADRLQLWLSMYQDFWSAPMLGHGAHNYAKFRDDPAQISENFVVEMFHSAGVIGGGLFLFATLVVAVRAGFLFARWNVLQAFPWGTPITAGYMAMFLSSLTNPGMLGGFFWAALALVAAAAHLARSAWPAVAPRDH